MEKLSDVLTRGLFFLGVVLCIHKKRIYIFTRGLIFSVPTWFYPVLFLLSFFGWLPQIQADLSGVSACLLFQIVALLFFRARLKDKPWEPKPKNLAPQK